jgi:hypothetical protein
MGGQQKQESQQKQGGPQQQGCQFHKTRDANIKEFLTEIHEKLVKMAAN